MSQVVPIKKRNITTVWRVFVAPKGSAPGVNRPYAVCAPVIEEAMNKALALAEDDYDAKVKPIVVRGVEVIADDVAL